MYVQQQLAEFLLDEVITKHFIFSRLPPGALSKVIGILKVINADVDDVIIRSGDRSHMMFILSSGEALLTTAEEQRIIKRGDSFGEEAWQS